MARLFDDASSQYLISGAITAPSLPITMACWVRSNDNTAGQVCMSAGPLSGSSNTTLALGMRGDVAGDPVRIVHVGSTAPPFPFADTTTGFSVDQWHHVCGVFTSASARAVYIDGGSKGTDTTAIGGTTDFDRYTVGVQITSGGFSRYFSGDIAYPCIWGAALTDADVVSLASGVHPSLMRPESILNLWELTGAGSPEPDRWGREPLNLTGSPAVSANPRIVLPRRSKLFYFPTGGGGGGGFQSAWARGSNVLIGV